MRYRRVYTKGGTYFFTLVTFQRGLVFKDQASIDLLEDAFRYTNERMPFEVVARVILPDHMHYIWTLPEDSSDYSTRWRLIKSHFTRSICKNGRVSEVASRRSKGEQDIWQRRFWEHLIRDENDLTRHVEYIHYNPVKHGFAKSAYEWPYSSFKDYVSMKLYPSSWGASEETWSGMDYME